jgi:hypothetical protein
MAQTTRNPQDATLRNVRAARKRVADLESRVQALEARVLRLEPITDETRRRREEQDY